MAAGVPQVAFFLFQPFPVTGAMAMAHPINIQTASYTVQVSDCTEPETFIFMNSTSSNALTVPTGLSSGSLINVIQYSSVQTVIVAGSGEGLNSMGASLSIGGQYQGASILIVNSSVALVTGSLA
jgi:hypothetical protein